MGASHLLVDTRSPAGRLPAPIAGPPPKANNDGNAPALAGLPSDGEPALCYNCLQPLTYQWSDLQHAEQGICPLL